MAQNGEQQASAMAAENPPLPLPLPDHERVAEWLAEINARTECFSCGKEEWILVVEDIVVALSQESVGPNGSPTGRMLRLLTLLCGQCSFVRQHSYNDFHKWYLQKQAEVPSL